MGVLVQTIVQPGWLVVSNVCFTDIFHRISFVLSGADRKSALSATVGAIGTRQVSVAAYRPRVHGANDARSRGGRRQSTVVCEATDCQVSEGVVAAKRSSQRAQSSNFPPTANIL